MFIYKIFFFFAPSKQFQKQLNFASMGKIKKGILGGFNGRVGNVIGGSWKGIAYMRSEAQSIKDPKTASQLRQRSLFSYVSEFGSMVLGIIQYGFKERAIKRSQFNYFVHSSIKDGVFTLNSSNELVIDYANLKFSDGTATQGLFTSLTPTLDQISLDVQQTAGSEITDGFYWVVVLDSETGEVFSRYNVLPASTTDVAVVSLPQSVRGDIGYVYAFVGYRDGMGVYRVSDTAYLGEVTFLSE